jgi:uncharacterized protein (TIGR03437 family)
MVSAQAADTVLGQITNSAADSFAGGISGDGRFVVFESRGNLATQNPRNADGNREIFLFDYAQRRIFQITDTKALLKDATKAPTFDNINVEIANVRPVISNDGRWIAFGSNAATPFGATPITDGTNPGFFNPTVYNVTTGTAPNTTTTNALTQDGNLEMWIYQIPAVAPVADLSAGDEVALTELAGGNFTQITNTVASRPPVAGTTTSAAFIADDNHDASINDDGSVVAFVSSRDLVAGGNAAPQNNDEVFTYGRASGLINQITTTPRGSAASPVYTAAPTISGPLPGSLNRIAFSSNAATPVAGITANNPETNEEIFYVDVDSTGALVSGTGKQVTVTAPTNAGDVVNIWSFGRRMSRDGRFIAFDSYAVLETPGSANSAAFALYVFDTTDNSFRRVGPRSDADSGASGGDVPHFPGFTNYTAGGTPQTLVFSSRLNITANGAIPSNQTDGLNPNAARPVQLYATALPPAAQPTFTRLTNLPAPNTIVPLTQALPSNSLERSTFSISLTEPGTGNPDQLSEVFYLLVPEEASKNTEAAVTYQTGASRLNVSASPVPTPTASPSPTPQTPSAVQGVSPGMLAVAKFGADQPITAKSAPGSISRRFQLPIELSGVTLTVNGAAAGLISVSPTEILFVVPPALTAALTGTEYDLVINNNGTEYKRKITVVPSRPDVFTTLATPGPGGRALALNVVNTVQTREPFTIRTLKYKGGRRIPTVLRLYLTGVNSIPAANISIRIGTVTIQASANPVLREPGVYTLDFNLPPTLAGAGDAPVVVSVTISNTTYTSRLDDTAPRIVIL